MLRTSLLSGAQKCNLLVCLLLNAHWMRIKLFNIYSLNLIYNQHLVDITNPRLSIVLTLPKMKLKTRLGGG